MTYQSYHIEKLVHGGLGLSRDKKGRIVLIEGVIEGEEVEIRLLDGGKKVSKGIATRILQPSQQRVPPPCPYYLQCGGCNFQHISYPGQLQAKKGIVADLLKRSNNPLLHEAADTILATPLPSPQQFHYRQRIRLHVDGDRVVGFHKRHSHNCVAITACLLAHPAINACLQESLQHPAMQKLLAQTDSLEILYDPDQAKTNILLHYKRKPRPADEQRTRELLQDLQGVSNIFFLGEDFAPSGKSTLSYTLPPMEPHTGRPLPLSLETGGFCQVNLEQNEVLVKTVLKLCRLEAGDTVLDLFCGMGNFSIPLAEKARSVLGVEGQGSAIRSARRNSDGAGQRNTEFIKSPIHRFCEKLEREQKSFDCILLDPPRQGAPGLADTLAALCRKHLIYVSCDPATLCRDLDHLLNLGFQLTTLQPIDMFPQTHHIETVALLKR